MTERDLNVFKRMLFMLPLITIVASLLIQWGSWQANSSNIQKQFTEQKAEYDKLFDKIEREKAEATLVETKFSNIEWKLDLIMKNLGVTYVVPPEKTK